MSAIFINTTSPPLYKKRGVKLSGVVRKLDYMMRIVLPREMCDFIVSNFESRYHNIRAEKY